MENRRIDQFPVPSFLFPVFHFDSVLLKIFAVSAETADHTPKTTGWIKVGPEASRLWTRRHFLALLVILLQWTIQVARCVGNLVAGVSRVRRVSNGGRV